MAIRNVAHVVGSTLILAACTPCPAPLTLSDVSIPCCERPGASHTASLDTGTAIWMVRPATAGVAQVAVAASDSAWTTALAPAKWVTDPAAAQAGAYVYELKFEVPRCAAPSTLTLAGQFAADNGAEIFVDSGTTPIATSLGPPNMGFVTANITGFTHTMSLPSGGTHTLRARVSNEGGPTGLIVRGTITNRCGDNS